LTASAALLKGFSEGLLGHSVVLRKPGKSQS
jgi:hypothetical protein